MQGIPMKVFTEPAFADEQILAMVPFVGEGVTLGDVAPKLIGCNASDLTDAVNDWRKKD